MAGHSSSVRALLSACWLSSLAASGCGDSSTTSQQPGVDAAINPDSRIAPDARMVDGGTGTGTGLVSNTPGASLVDIGNPATPNAVLLSSNLLQEPSGSQVFQQWLGEVKNSGSTVICQVSINVSFRNASGTQLASFFTFADADPYALTGLPLSIGCIAPGQIGSFYDNAFVATQAQLADVTRIEVSFEVHEYAGVVPAPHAPVVTSHEAPVFGTEFGVVGTFTGAGGAIYNIGFDAYPRAANGLVLAQLFATDLDTLEPGATFSFMTIGTPTAFTEYRQFAEFIDGPKPAVRVASPAASALVHAAGEVDAARRTLRQAVRDRAARALATTRSQLP
jgi:hypothetical protein